MKLITLLCLRRTPPPTAATASRVAAARHGTGGASRSMCAVFLASLVTLLPWPAGAAEHSAVSEPVIIDLSTPEVLAAATKDPDPEVRVAGVNGLVKRHDPQFVRPVLEALGDEDATVQQAAQKHLRVMVEDSRLLPAFATLAAESDLRLRRWSTRFLVGRQTPPDSLFVRQVAGILTSPPSLIFTAGAAAIVFGLGCLIVAWRQPRRIPGPAGGFAVVTVLAGVALYHPAIAATTGSLMFMGLAFAPAVLALVLGTVAGIVCWLAASRRISTCVCRYHFQRFVPGPTLGWFERWTGRQWIRHRGRGIGVAGLAKDAVCRGHQCADRHDGVHKVLAVLDDSATWGTTWFKDGVLRVNWLKYKKPFDFEGVEIESAPTKEVEEFVRQVRYQSEERLQRALGRMECVIGRQAKLEESTLRVLAPIFGKVTHAAK